MAAKKIKISSLSEGLRKEVRKYIKEGGRTKISQMPKSLKKRIIKEYKNYEIPQYIIIGTILQNIKHPEWGDWKVIDEKDDYYTVTYTEGDKFKKSIIMKNEISNYRAVNQPYLMKKNKIEEGETSYDSSGNPILPWGSKGSLKYKGDTLNGGQSINNKFDKVDNEEDDNYSPLDDDDFIGDSVLQSAMEDAERDSLNGNVVHVNKTPRGDYALSDWYDDELTVASYENGRKLNENNKKQNTKNKSIKLSYLSEGLRNEVKKQIKEGKTKLSMLPSNLKRLIENELGNMDMEKNKKLHNSRLRWKK